MRYGDFLGSLSLASSHLGGFPYSVAHMAGEGQPAQAARPRYCTRIRSMRSLSMCPSSNLWRPRAYRPQRGRGHVTTIHDSVPSKIQIRQWFVTNYSNSCCLDCISAMD